jgi:hypothetical protein
MVYRWEMPLGFEVHEEIVCQDNRNCGAGKKRNTPSTQEDEFGSSNFCPQSDWKDNEIAEVKLHSNNFMFTIPGA